MDAAFHLKRTRVKICGFTDAGQARYAASLGVDAVGLVFYPPSPRSVNIVQAQSIIAALPPFVTVVGLFVNETAARIQNVLAQTGLDLIQFHGDETADFCRSFGRPFIKAIQVRPETDIVAESERYSGARGLLLDAWHPDHRGGTGDCFNWQRIPEQCALPLILAGGLNTNNVQQALTTTRLACVDVSSGVEATKGQKDRHKMATFIDKIQQFDHHEPDSENL